MKKFLSIFVALAMVLSLFAGVGARTAKAATTLPAAIAGITVPVTGGTPVTAGTVAATVYASAVSWSPALVSPATTFAAHQAYTAAITLTAITPATFTGVPANYFSVAGAVSTTNAADSGVVTAVFPATGAALLPLTISAPTLTLSKVYDGTTTAAVTPGVLAGVVSPDVVTVTAAANYATAAVGTGKTITVTYTLAGANAAKYTAPANYSVITGVITTAPGTVKPLGTVTLANPTQVAGTANVLLSWTYSVSPTDVTAFRISRNGAVIGYVAPGTMTYTDATTVAGLFYSYYVMPTNNMGDGTQSFSASIVPTTAVAVTTTTGTLTLTPAGNFVGGVDGSGAAGVDAIGTVVSGSGTSYVVNVTTAGVGSFDTANGITVLHDTGVTSIDTDWATTGMKSISFTGSITGIFNVGDTISVAGSSTKGVGKVISINAAGTLAVVNVTTAAVGVIGPKVYTTSYADSTDLDWLTAGTAQPITFDAAVTLAAGDVLDVAMLQAVQGTSASAFLIVSGTPVKGDIATVTWQDTLAASHTVSYTAVTGDTATSVALALSQLIHALDLTTGNVDATVAGSLITLTQDVAGVAGNGKTLTATTTASVTPTLTIHTLGGLSNPGYVENGKTIQLVAVDATGAVVSVTWTSVGSAAPAGPSAVVNANGLVTADLALTGVTVVTATSGSATGVFAVVVIPVQIITSLTINLVPAVPVSTTSQQFGAIASNAAYSALDYTTQAVWTDALPVASIAATTGLLTYSTDETGNVYASAGGITATAAVKITTGVVTLVTTVGPVTKVIVLTIGSDIVTVDDKATTVDSPPAIVAGRTFVPIRFIAETFGSTVTWLPETKGITIVLGDTTIGLQIGNATAVINGTIIALEAAPYINPDADRTMVPLRVISESFGGNVAWDPINHIITITYVLPVLPAA
ncbi:MAG TPA: stalk domain-containing protein [Candidatus Deferrimicrobium sp.]|nr:stalk domain-containing protein [Candidatus Deferrimicrobium sp.]